MSTPHKELRREVGVYLRMRRAHARLSLDKVAKRIGFDNVSFVAKVEQGKASIPLDRVGDFAQAYEIDPAHLARIVLVAMSHKDGYFNRDEKFLNHMTTALTSGNERLRRPKEERFGRARGDKSLHPTPKPLELMKYVISALTKEGDSIFDPFSGTGTTAAAAKIMGRKCAAVEYDFGYFVSGAKRLNWIRKR